MKENSSNEPDLSICDILKNRTSEIVKKLENQLPLTTQQSSDLYAAYLHSFDDLFGTCYISQKEFFDKLNIPQKNLKNFDKYLESFSKSYQDWIELNSKLWYHYVQMRLSDIKSFDEFVHVTMDSYARTLARYNSMIDSANSQKEKD